MFCHKCGAKMLDGSAFCAKCGARLLSENSSQTTETITTGVTGVTLERDNDIMPQQPSSEQSQTVRDSIPMHTSNLNDDAEFRSFVNKRVQEMTKCSSAEELLKKHPMRIPLILCYGFFIFIGIMISKNTDNIGLALILIAFCILLAYGLSYLIGWATILRYLIKHRSELNGEISSLDTDNLILFLNNRLAYLRPGLGEWGYFSMGYENPEKMAAKLVVRHLEKREKNIMHIGSQCSKWYSPFSIISLRCGEEKPDVTGYGIKSGFTTAINYNMSIYECMYRSAPIVSAAMEYYREHRQTIVESSERNFALEDNVLKINSKYRFFSKYKKLLIIVIAIILVILLIASANSKTYIQDISNMVPTIVTEAGANYTYGQVFDRYIDSQKWKKDGSGDNYTVYLNGSLRSTKKSIRLTFDVSESKDFIEAQLTEVKIDEIRATDKSDITSFILFVFGAYEEKLSPEEFCTEVFDNNEISEIFFNTFEIMETAEISTNNSDAVTKNADDSYSLDNEDIADMYISMVRYGYRAIDPDTTYDEAFSSFFANPNWIYFKSTDGQDIVEFIGYCYYSDTYVEARIQFAVDEPNSTFDVQALAFNDVPQDMVTLSALIEKVFSEANTGSAKKTKEEFEYSYDYICGQYEYDGQDGIYYVLNIDPAENGIYISQNWKGSFLYDHVYASYDNFSGDTITFECMNVSQTAMETHTLKFVPCELSDSGIDTFYIDDNMEMPYLRGIVW